MSISYDITSRNWDNTDVDVSITDDDGFNGIKDIDNDNASFNEGTLDGLVPTDNTLQLWEPDFYASFNTNENICDLNNGISYTPSSNNHTYLVDGREKNGRAVYIKENTTNLVASDNRHTSEYVYDGTGHQIWNEYFTISTEGWSDSDKLTISADLKIDQTRKDAGGQMRLYYWHAKDSDSWMSPSSSIDCTSTEWGRFSRTVTIDTSSGQQYIRFGIYHDPSDIDAGTSYIRNVQIERKPYPTEFVDGSRSGGGLSYTPSDFGIDFNSKNWTVMCWCKYEDTMTEATRSALFELGSYYISGETDIAVGTRQSTNRLRMYGYEDRNGQFGGGVDFTSTEAQEWMLVALTCNNSTLTLHTVSNDSGYQSATDDANWDESTNPIRDNLFVGRYGWDDGQIKGKIEDLVVLPYELSAEKIQNIGEQPNKSIPTVSGSREHSLDIAPIKSLQNSNIKWDSREGFNFTDGDYIVSKNALSGGDPTITLSLWAKSNEPLQDDWTGLIGLGTGRNTNTTFCINSDAGSHNMTIHTWANSTPGFSLDNEWHHYVAVNTGSSHQLLYVDGNLVGEMNQNINIPSDNLIIGKRSFDYARESYSYKTWDGQISDVRVYEGKELSGAEVNDLYNGADVTSGLTSHYKKENISNKTIVDRMGNNNANLVRGLLLDGDSKITVPDDSTLDITGGITLQATFDIYNLPSEMDSSYPCLIGKSSDTYNFIVYAGGTDDIGLRMNYSTGTRLEHNYTLTSKHLVTVTATYDGSDLKLYENGNLKTSKSGSITMTTDNSDINIGSGWEGVMLDAQIWETALTQTEIQNNLTNGLDDTEAGLVSHYRFDEGQGDVLKDYAGNNDGAIDGCRWIGTEATNITVESSLDDGQTWEKCSNNNPIPNLPANTEGEVLKLRESFTNGGNILENVETTIETPIQYKWSLDTATPSSWNDVSNPLTQSSEGEWYLHTRHFEDNNPVTEYTGTYNIDKTPPAVPNVNLTNNTSHSFSLDWTNDDSLSGIDYVELYAKTSDGTVIDINGDSNTEDYITLTATDDTYTVDGLSEYSDYDYKVITYDKAGNSSADGFYTMTTDDITEPVIGYNVNSTSWQNTDVDETVNVDDAGGSGVANAWYKWTNSATQPTDGWVVMGTTTDFSTSQSQEGEWYLHIKATDNYDNTAYDYSGAYKIDKTVPTISSTNISIDSPTGIYDTYTATVTWTIEDDRAGVDRTEIGFYVDGAWYYDETNLPDGITADIDMDNVTGNGSKTATFSNVPREIDIATSWQGYDIATNETVEEQSETVYTPRIYETYTTVAPTSYEIGKTDTLIIPTEYEIGITDSTQSPSEYIIDVLSKSTSAPSVYGIGLTQASTIAPSEYEIGITDSKSAPSLYDIIALYDEPILVSGKYKQGLRIGTSDIEVDVSEFSGGWTMHLFRRGEQDKEFRDIFALSSGDVYIDGEVDESYDTSWFTHTEDKITIKSGAIDIDELLIIPYELVPSEIKTLTGSAFYDTSPNITIGKPSTANMEVL